MPFVLTWNSSHAPAPRPVDAEPALEQTLAFWSSWMGRCRYDGPYGEARPAHGGHPALSPYDDADTQDTIVLGSLGDGETDDPRARIPAWEDIVFGVRRHR